MNEDRLGEMIQEMNSKSSKVYHIVSRMMKYREDDIEDVLQDTALRALRKYSQFRGESQFSTWYTKIAIRQSLMKIRRSKNKNEPEFVLTEDLEKFGSRLMSPEALVIRKEVREKLVAGILQLPPKLRREFLISYVLGIRVNTSTLKARRFRARARMREILAP